MDFEAVIAQDPAVFNQAQIDHAPLAPLSSGVVNIHYDDQKDHLSDVPGILQAKDNSGGNYQHFRCNFYPTYETDAQAVPVCEVVARAKRLNVMPDTVELVWFDGPDLDHVGSTEYGNEAFALFLALRGAGADTSSLCQRQGEVNVLTRRFAHGSGFAK